MVECSFTVLGSSPFAVTQKKYLPIFFASPSKSNASKNTEKEVGEHLIVCVLNLLTVVSILPSLVVVNLVKVEK